MQSIDSTPIAIVVVVFAILTIVCYEIGFRLGRWWQDRLPGEQEGPTGVLVGALLGLMAFMLAVTMGMAADRFDARRGLVLAEANAIQAVYLQAGYLPEPETQELRELVRTYAPLRVSTVDTAQLHANIVRSVELQDQMWAIEARVAREGYLSDLTSSLGDSLTDLVTISESRVVTGLYARVPETVLLLLLAGSALSLAMVGYSAGLTGRRSFLSAAVLIVALGAVLTIVIDLDRPQEGFLRVSQQALVDVIARIGPPAP